MTDTETLALKSGAHWINRLASDVGRDALEEVTALDAWDWTPSEIALAILATAFPSEVTRGAVITCRLWPWEKNLIRRAAYPNKQEDWIRQALVERAMVQLVDRNPKALDTHE